MLAHLSEDVVLHGFWELVRPDALDNDQLHDEGIFFVEAGLKGREQVVVDDLTIKQLFPLLLVLFKVFDESIEQGVLVLAVTKFEPSLMGQPIRARILHLSNTLKPGHW